MISLNGVVVTPTLFPDNTSQVWKVPAEAFEGICAKVVWTFEREAEFMHLAQLKTLLDKKSITATLLIKYLPYGRQDKEVSNKTTFGLVTFAHLLNSLKFTEVMAIDPHSKAAKELIKNFTEIMPFSTIALAAVTTEASIYCYPDKGAMLKYSNLQENSFVYGKKVRNQDTGVIESMELVGDVKDQSVLIVDDICDGGGTFCWMASLLYDAGAKDVNLYVSHGIFSKGLRPLKEAKINRIFTKYGEISEYQKNICYKEIS